MCGWVCLDGDGWDGDGDGWDGGVWMGVFGTLVFQVYSLHIQCIDSKCIQCIETPSVLPLLYHIPYTMVRVRVPHLV